MLARHVSGNSYAHLQEHWTVEYSLWYEAPYMLPAVGLDVDELQYFIPQAVSTVQCS
jgi:hypothetical protein